MTPLHRERADYIQRAYIVKHVENLEVREDDFVFFVKPGVVLPKPAIEDDEYEFKIPKKIMTDICYNLYKEIRVDKRGTPMIMQYYAETDLVTAVEEKARGYLILTPNVGFRLVTENLDHQRKQSPIPYNENRIKPLDGMKPFNQIIPSFDYNMEEQGKIIGQIDTEQELYALPYFDLPGIQIRYADLFPIIGEDMNPRPISRFVGPFLLHRFGRESAIQQKDVNIFIHYIMRDSKGKPYMESPETKYDGRIYCFNPTPPLKVNLDYVETWFRIIDRYHNEELYKKPPVENYTKMPETVLNCPEPKVMPEPQSLANLLEELNNFLGKEPDLYESYNMILEDFASLLPEPQPFRNRTDETDETDESDETAGPIPKRMCESLCEEAENFGIIKG